MMSTVGIVLLIACLLIPACLLECLLVHYSVYQEKQIASSKKATLYKIHA